MESLNEFVERELPSMKNFLDLISVSSRSSIMFWFFIRVFVLLQQDYALTCLFESFHYSTYFIRTCLLDILSINYYEYAFVILIQ